jgi:hypothetical protein
VPVLISDDDELKPGMQEVSVSEADDGEVLIIEINMLDMNVTFSLQREIAMWLAKEILDRTGENI